MLLLWSHLSWPTPQFHWKDQLSQRNAKFKEKWGKGKIHQHFSLVNFLFLLHSYAYFSCLAITMKKMKMLLSPSFNICLIFFNKERKKDSGFWQINEQLNSFWLFYLSAYFSCISKSLKDEWLKKTAHHLKNLGASFTRVLASLPSHISNLLADWHSLLILLTIMFL